MTRTEFEQAVIDAGVKGSTWQVLMGIASTVSWKEGRPQLFASQTVLAKRSGHMHRATVNAVLQELVEAGWLVPHTAAKGLAKRYSLRIPASTPVAQDDTPAQEPVVTDDMSTDLPVAVDDTPVVLDDTYLSSQTTPPVAVDDTYIGSILKEDIGVDIEDTAESKNESFEETPNLAGGVKNDKARQAALAAISRNIEWVRQQNEAARRKRADAQPQHAQPQLQNSFFEIEAEGGQDATAQDASAPTAATAATKFFDLEAVWVPFDPANPPTNAHGTFTPGYPDGRMCTKGHGMHKHFDCCARCGGAFKILSPA